VLDFGSGAGRDAIRALARSLLGLDLTARSEAARAAAANGTVVGDGGQRRHRFS
jgi:hypothetical protein